HWNKIFRLTIRIANYQPRFLPRASPPRTSNSWCPLLNFLRLLRGRLIGRTPDFESGYRGSSPRPGAILLNTYKRCTSFWATESKTGFSLLPTLSAHTTVEAVKY